MNQTRERLYDIEKNGYQLDFGNVFNHAFENYKKIAVYVGLVLIVFSILFLIFAAGSVITLFGAKEIAEVLTPENIQNQNFPPSFLLIRDIGIVFLACLISPFEAAFFKMADSGDKNEEFNVSTLFTYYRFPYLQRIILITFIVSSVNFLLVQYLTSVNLTLVGNFIITPIISLLTFASIPLVIFGKLDTIEAIKYSIMIVIKKPLLLAALLIIGVIGSLVGIIGCCIGLFFTAAFTYSIKYAIYSSIVGIDTTTETESKLL